MATDDSSNFLVSESQLALADARKQKSERLKAVGDPLVLPGKAIAIEVTGNDAWVADNTTVTRKIDLETGKTLQVYKGHRGPVSALTLWARTSGDGPRQVLITGSWDKTIKLWDTNTKDLLSSTDGHADFVKSLLVIPSTNLLISGGSDKIVRFWDLSSTAIGGNPLKSLGSISSHTRPIECLDGHVLPGGSVELCTGDTMGIIRLWSLTKEDQVPPRWKATLKAEFKHHRTKITDLHYGSGQLWTASSDDTVQIRLVPEPSDNKKTPPPITHSTAVRCILPLALTAVAEPYLITGSGDFLRVYDVSSLAEPELISEIDAHWHDVTAIRLWVRKTVGDDKLTRIEPWIISTSLDGTIRKWRLSELLAPKPKQAPVIAKKEKEKPGFALSAEEEQELAELLDSD